MRQLVATVKISPSLAFVCYHCSINDNTSRQHGEAATPSPSPPRKPGGRCGEDGENQTMTDNEEDGVEHAGVEAEDALPTAQPHIDLDFVRLHHFL